jgi:hypothetical protein
MDYSPYGEMALNFLTGEAEFLEQVELKLEGKKPKFIPRIRDAMYAQWSEGIDFLYKMGPEDTEIHNSYVNLFQEMAPNMVATWK